MEHAEKIEVDEPFASANLAKTRGVLEVPFRADLTWTGNPDAEGYEVQRGQDDTWTTIKAPSGDLLFPSEGPFAYTDIVREFDTEYSYRVRSVFENGKHVSGWSKTRTVQTAPGNVLYEVEGTSTSASITLRTGSGTIQRDVSLPMKTKSGDTGLWINAPGIHPYISAQANSFGTVTCRITLNGVVISENTSTGRYSIATCTS